MDSFNVLTAFKYLVKNYTKNNILISLNLDYDYFDLLDKNCLFKFLKSNFECETEFCNDYDFVPFPYGYNIFIKNNKKFISFIEKLKEFNYKYSILCFNEDNFPFFTEIYNFSFPLNYNFYIEDNKLNATISFLHADVFYVFYDIAFLILLQKYILFLLDKKDIQLGKLYVYFNFLKNSQNIDAYSLNHIKPKVIIEKFIETPLKNKKFLEGGF